MSFDSPAHPLSPEHQQARRQLRISLRQQRRRLSTAQQQQAARGLARQLARQPALVRAGDVAAYVPSDGEIDPMPFLRQLMQQGVRVWLPVLSRRPGRDEIGMHFARMPAPGLKRAGWQSNRFGIREPRNRTHKPAWHMDALLMPLVGFDARCQRLGMGGGFYDRLLATLSRRPCRPRLIGLAHDCQQVDVLPSAAWDQPVDTVVTATRTISRAG